MFTLFEDAELTAIESSNLVMLERTINHGLQTFVEVGTALLEIRDNRLYRQEFSTFEEYCAKRWGMDKRIANLQIAAAKVIGNLGSIVPILPVTESQARPLTRLSPDLQREAWQRAVDTAPNGKITAAHVASVVDSMTEDEPDEYVQTIDRPVLRLAAANHIVSDDPDYDGDEWYTPVEYIEAARQLMGGIDLDPASCEAAQETVKAAYFYSKQDNGLSMPWFGCVWLNPPYSTPLIRQFVTKLIQEHDAGNITEAVILTNNSSDTAWFHDLLSRYPACFTRGRVQFWRPDSGDFGARQGQALFYLGENVTAFRDAFANFGQVVMRL